MINSKRLVFFGVVWGAMVVCGCVHPAQGAGLQTQPRKLAPAPGEANASGNPCEPEIQDLTAELYKRIGSCSVVLRLGYERRDILGFQVFCDRYRQVDEAAARASAELDMGLGKSASLLGTKNSSGQYIFQETEKDRGTVVVLSGYTGLTLFGGALDLSGGGAIQYPLLWRSSRVLGKGCARGAEVEKKIGFNLIQGTQLEDKEVAEVTDAVMNTALPEAFRRNGYLFESVVFLYSPRLSKLDPQAAEWIVILNGGWLE